MSELMYLLAAFFLPLFPFSMAFNRLFDRVHNAELRALLLLAWPQFGLVLLNLTGDPIPTWIVPWALATAALYAFRALALREVGLWIGFLATSDWAMLWLAAAPSVASDSAELYALAFSIPFVLLALLAAWLERRMGAAYTDLFGGLAQNLPRFSGVLVVVVLAAVATPVFPSFFSLLFMVMKAIPTMPGAAAAIVGVWLLWSWAGARLVQGLVVGPSGPDDVADFGGAATWSMAIALTVISVGGVYLIGELP